MTRYRETSGLGNYAKENAHSFKRVRCPFGSHKFNGQGECACGHVSPRVKQTQINKLNNPALETDK